MYFKITSRNLRVWLRRFVHPRLIKSTPASEFPCGFLIVVKVCIQVSSIMYNDYSKIYRIYDVNIIGSTVGPENYAAQKVYAAKL